MPHTTLLDFEFTYARMIPRVPIRFFHRNGTIQDLSYEKFDSGSTHIVIPRTKAVELGLQLLEASTSYTAVDRVASGTAIVNFRLGNEERYVEYVNIPIGVIDGPHAQILIGIRPIWEDYIVTINAHERRIIMEPRR